MRTRKIGLASAAGAPIRVPDIHVGTKYHGGSGVAS
ncbi:MAG: hypothetical protein ACI9MB_001089, partial [Verrucomicrobiales bacterium]